MAWTEAYKTQILNALTSVGAQNPCGRCSHGAFALVEGFATVSLAGDPHSIQIGGAGIPAVVVACAKCGHLSLHAARILGLVASA